MKIKKIIALVLVALLMVSVTGYAAETNELLADGKAVTLRFAWWGSQSRHEKTQRVVEMFMEKYPNVTIEMEPYDSNGYFQKMGVLVGANDVWDIWQFGNNFAEYEGWFIDLKPYIDAGIIDTTNIANSFLENTQYKGMQASMSLGMNTYCVAYNPSLFAEAGIEEPADNWTWEDYKTAAEAIKAVTGEFGSSLLNHLFGAAMAGVPQQEKGLNFLKSDNSGLEITKPDYLVPYFQLLKDMMDKGVYPNPGEAAEIGADVAQDFITTGEAGMACIASNQFITLSESAEKNGITGLKIAYLPRYDADGPSGLRTKSSQGLCISPTCEYPEVAAAFIDFMINDEEANMVLAAERGIPVNSKVREALSSQLTYAQKQIFEFVDKLAVDPDSSLVNINEPAPLSAIHDRINLNVEKVYANEMTPEQAAQDVFDFANAQFNN